MTTRAEELANEIRIWWMHEKSMSAELFNKKVTQALKTYADEKCKPLVEALEESKRLCSVLSWKPDLNSIDLIEIHFTAKTALNTYESEGGAEK